MPSDLNEETITEAVQRTFDTSTDERFRQVLVSLLQHLHDFAREVQLTGDEWFTAMDFLERVGKMSSPTHQEVMLLSDILGFSMLGCVGLAFLLPKTAPPIPLTLQSKL